MPRAVTAVERGPGFSTYLLGKREAFTILAASFVLDDPTFAGVECVNVFDCLDPTGELIYRQMLGTVQYRPAQYSLAAAGQPWTVDFNFNEYFPGYLAAATYPMVSAPLPLLRLTGSCMVRVYATQYSQPPTVDPFTTLEPTITVPNLHLWVEDTPGRRELPANSPPLLTHVAA